MNPPSTFMVRLIATCHIARAMVRDRNKWDGADMRRVMAGETDHGRQLIAATARRTIIAERALIASRRARK
jgi:hypothetical protein